MAELILKAAAEGQTRLCRLGVVRRIRVTRDNHRSIFDLRVFQNTNNLIYSFFASLVISAELYSKLTVASKDKGGLGETEVVSPRTIA